MPPPESHHKLALVLSIGLTSACTTNTFGDTQGHTSASTDLDSTPELTRTSASSGPSTSSTANSTEDPTETPLTSTPETCGDGTIDTGEACDGEVWCNDDCTIQTGCGNGIVEDGEDCDHGNLEQETLEDSPVCDADCTKVECGDGHLNAAAGERCESGAGCILPGTPGFDPPNRDCTTETRAIFVTGTAYEIETVDIPTGFYSRGQTQQAPHPPSADARCSEEAVATDLATAMELEPYRAWLSLTGEGPSANAIDHTQLSDEVLVGVESDGQGGLKNFVFAIFQDDHYTSVSAFTRTIAGDFPWEPTNIYSWTGTNEAGQAATSKDCSGWTDPNGLSVTFGRPGVATQWTQGHSLLCGGAAHFYCVEQPH